MIIDCDTCQVRGLACGDCVIGVLMGAPEPAAEASEQPPGTPSGAPIVQLDAPEWRALAVLADQGLVPRLRLVAPDPRRARDGGDTAERIRDAG